MLVLELMGEAVSVVGIGVLLLLVLLLGVLLLLLLGVLLLLLRARVARLLLLLIGSTRIGGVVATVFAWGAHSCGRYRGELIWQGGGSRRRRSSRGVVNRRGRGGRRKKGIGKKKGNRKKMRPGTGPSDSGVPRVWGRVNNG